MLWFKIVLIITFSIKQNHLYMYLLTLIYTSWSNWFFLPVGRAAYSHVLSAVQGPSVCANTSRARHDQTDLQPTYQHCPILRIEKKCHLFTWKINISYATLWETKYWRTTHTATVYLSVSSTHSLIQSTVLLWHR